MGRGRARCTARDALFCACCLSVASRRCTAPALEQPRLSQAGRPFAVVGPALPHRGSFSLPRCSHPGSSSMSPVRGTGDPLRQALLARRSGATATALAPEKQEDGTTQASKVSWRSAAFCIAYVLLCSSGPILLDWVKRAHGGRFRFSVAALTFHAWAIASCLGLIWTGASLGRPGLRRLNRPDMLWRFCITTGLFTAGDMLSFASMQHLDVGTFSLLGKSFSIVITLVLSRLVRGKPHTTLQYLLVVGVAAATVMFCREEQIAKTMIATAAVKSTASSLAVPPPAVGEWLFGLVQRVSAVGLTSLGAVLQESLFKRERNNPFMMQQCWMGCGAMLMSLFTLRCLYGLPLSHLLVGFGDWRVLVLLGTYITTGLMTGLIVKHLGAVAKALCVPIYLGGCYCYAVCSGSAALTLQALAAWAASTACVLTFAVSKAWAQHQQLIRQAAQ